jgi:hypothetical protein
VGGPRKTTNLKGRKEILKEKQKEISKRKEKEREKKICR